MSISASQSSAPVRDAKAPLTNGALALRIALLYLAPRWRALVVAMLAAAAAAGFSGILIDILRPAIDNLADPAARWRTPALIIVLAIGRGLTQVIQALLVNRIGNGVVGDVQKGLFGCFVRADLARLRAGHTGGFVSQVLFDAGLVREAATTGLVNVLQQGLTLIAMGVVMARTDWRLALFVALAAPLASLVLRRFLGRAVKSARRAMEATGALSTAIMEGLDGVRVVKMENREAYEEARVGAVIAERQRHIISGDDARAAAAPVSEALMTVVIAAVLAYEAWRASQGRPDIGAFIAFFAALLSAAQALRQVSNLMTVFSQGLTAARRLFEAMDVEPEVRDRPDAAALTVASAHLRLSGVEFAYADGVRVLHGVDLEARRGEIVAIVGPSGSGKSTILNLIPRFYDVTGGGVILDGRDVREVTLASLRRNIALVTQEPFLFDDTVAANIAYGRDGATPAQIEAAARLAAAHEFIEALPQGYQTSVGEAGARLSGGQRQRIAIARAFLKDAPILLLDEATSALDTESEAQVQSALARLMAGRTTLIIAHRLSTIRNADRIYVLESGRVVEVGDHTELMRGEGLYARLAGAQTEFDLTPEPEAAS